MSSYYYGGQGYYRPRPGYQPRSPLLGGQGMAPQAYAGAPVSPVTPIGGLGQQFGSTYAGAQSQPQPQPQQATGMPQPQMPDLSNLNYQNDPILQRIHSLSQQSISEAQAEALRQQQQLAIGYGDPALAAQLGLSKDVQAKAAGNAFGTLQELTRTYQRRNVFDINRPLSDQRNLFYSSERGRQLALSGEEDLRQRAMAQASVQQRLAEIQQMLVQARLDAQRQNIEAEQQAYQNASQQVMYAAGA